VGGEDAGGEDVGEADAGEADAGEDEPTVRVPAPQTEPMVCMNPIGHLTIKWRGSELNFAYDGDTRVGALKTWLEGQTFVARSQQKLVGWQSRQGAAVGDSEAIASIRPARKLMLVGTPSDDLKMAGLDLERSRRTSRYVRDDLREWGSLGLPVQAYGGGRGRTRASSE